MEALAALPDSPRIVKILPVLIPDCAALATYEEECITAGYEGVMVRTPNSPYKCGCSLLRKLKKHGLTTPEENRGGSRRPWLLALCRITYESARWPVVSLPMKSQVFFLPLAAQSRYHCPWKMAYFSTATAPERRNLTGKNRV